MQQKDSTTVIRSAQSLVMDGMTAPVKMDSLLTKMDIHVKVSVIVDLYVSAVCACCVGHKCIVIIL